VYIASCSPCTEIMKHTIDAVPKKRYTSFLANLDTTFSSLCLPFVSMWCGVYAPEFVFVTSLELKFCATPRTRAHWRTRFGREPDLPQH
jgi:hypothetical protein